MKGASALALFGGNPVRSKPFPRHPIVGKAEERAVLEVVRSGEFSTFIASPGQHFLGGKKIRAFEELVRKDYGVRFAVAMNSATACLHAAMAALGVGPGDEVIVPPYTFTSTATCVLMQGGTPVFADIEPETFCLDLASVAGRITPKTKAIILVHLFGHPGNLEGFLRLAKRHSLALVEDCAQAPGARYRGTLVGTIGACGVLSFQESKHVMTGEGGMLLTNDEPLAQRAQMIRNHGEVIAEGPYRNYTAHLLGWNYRMTELEAALGMAQWKRLDGSIRRRIELADSVTTRLARLAGITPPVTKPGMRHAFFVYCVKYDAAKVGMPRSEFAKALRAEGIPIQEGYVRPLYLNPLYERMNQDGRYAKGSCPVAERMHGQELLMLSVVRPPATTRDMRDIVEAFEKVVTYARRGGPPASNLARRLPAHRASRQAGAGQGKRVRDMAAHPVR